MLANKEASFILTNAVQCLVETRDREGERNGEKDRKRGFTYSFLHLLQDIKPKETGV
jgi:hypothetical protein